MHNLETHSNTVVQTCYLCRFRGEGLRAGGNGEVNGHGDAVFMLAQGREGGTAAGVSE